MTVLSTVDTVRLVLSVTRLTAFVPIISVKMAGKGQSVTNVHSFIFYTTL